MIVRLNRDVQNFDQGSLARKSCGARKIVADFGAALNALVVALLLSMLVSLGGCSDGEGRPEPFNGFGGDGSSLGSGVAVGACEQGAERVCGYKVSQGKDSLTCYQGVQQCKENGQWGECGSGTLITIPEPDEKEAQAFKRGIGDFDIQGTAHVGNGSLCTPSDLCDPYCYELQESTPIFTPATSNSNSVLCPTTTALTECGSTVGCSHSPCQTGLGLSSTLCGSCVATVCTALPNCCNTGGPNWDSTCRDKAFELCIKQQPPLSMCDFGVFSETTINNSNSALYNAGSKIGSMGNIILAAGAVPNQVITPGHVLIRNLNSGSNIVMSGPSWIGGGVYADNGNRTLVGDFHVGRGMYLTGGINITGNVYASNPYDVRAIAGPPAILALPGPPSPASNALYIYGQNPGTVTRSYTPGGAANIGTPPTITTKTAETWPAPFSAADAGASATMPNGGVVPARTTCTAGAGSTTYNNGGTNTLVPGSYGDVTISNGNTVLLLDGQGDYFFRSLKFDSGCNNCKLRLGNAAGDYTGTARPTTGNVGYNVAVCNGTFEMMSSAKVYREDGTTVMAVADAERLTVYVHPSNGASMGNSAVFTGLLIVPGGTFTAQNNSTVNGAVWANAVTTDTNFVLNQIGKLDCESMVTAGTCNTTTPAAAVCEEAPVTTTGMCPAGIVGTPTANVPGLPASNFNAITTPGANTKCRYGADCQTNMRCNNVATFATTGACTGWNKCGTTSLSAGAIATACATDPCVQRITAVNALCTPTSWSSTCRDLIPSICDATCSSPVGTVTGTCVDNTSLAAESGCSGTNGFDLAVGYVCTQNTIPVCNHGATNYSGALTVSWWLVGSRQFAPLTTPTATATGSFTTAAGFSVAAGACTNIVVSTPTTGSLMTAPGTNDYTVMVDPARAKSECNVAVSGNTGRRLDNWSWYNHSVTCVNTPNVSEYDYVADCSAAPSTYPRWRLLRWGAAPGAGQTVRFYAEVDSTTPACTGTGGGDPCTSVANNTQTAVTFPSGGGTAPVISAAVPCALSATNSNCAVNLTTALGLPTSQSQPNKLTIRAEWPFGVATPLWDVTYTCEFDQ